MRWSEEDLAAYNARQLDAPRDELPLADEPESRFMARVLAFAKAQGYRTYHPHRSDRSTPGWFDLAMARPGDKLVLAELKRTGGKQTVAQRDWYEDLQRIERVETYLWHPTDWPLIEDILRRKA